MRMKPALYTLLLLPFLFASAREPKPVVWSNPHAALPKGVTHHQLESASMDRTVGFSVYLPDNYESSATRFPVVYFLHGHGGNENSDGPSFAKIVHRLAQAGEVPAAICVFPNGGVSGYRDHPDDKIMVETMITQELIPLVDDTFRTLPRRESRVIAGYSMGGAGALRLALLYPERFSAAASWAAAINYPRRGSSLPNEFSAARLSASIPQGRLLMIVGYDDDVTYHRHPPFLAALSEAKYPFTFRTLSGVPHNLGLYYQRTGDELVRFLLAGIETDPNQDLQ